MNPGLPSLGVHLIIFQTSKFTKFSNYNCLSNGGLRARSWVGPVLFPKQFINSIFQNLEFAHLSFLEI